MKKRLANVAPVQLGIVFGVLYGLISLVIFVPMGLFFCGVALLGGHSIHASGPVPALLGIIFGCVMMLIIPLVYAAMGFIGGLIAGACYNLVAKWTGGIEFTVVDAPVQ